MATVDAGGKSRHLGTSCRVSPLKTHMHIDGMCTKRCPASPRLTFACCLGEFWLLLRRRRSCPPRAGGAVPIGG